MVTSQKSDLKSKTQKPKSSQQFSIGLIVSIFESCGKIVSGSLLTFGALAAILAFIYPVIWSRVDAFIASRTNLVGYVYYEISKEGDPTTFGQMFLLSDSEKGEYNEIKMGDKLATESKVILRTRPNLNSREKYILSKDQCLIVIEDSKPENKTPKEKLKNAFSGGYLKVATTSCTGVVKAKDVKG